MADGIEMTGPKSETWNGWNRACKYNGVEYRVSVARGRRVRIPYKPRGRNIGWKWQGAVYTVNRCLWSGEVPGSIGVRGLLTYAGVFAKESADVPI